MFAGLLLRECDDGGADEDVAQEKEGEKMAYIHVPRLRSGALLSAKGGKRRIQIVLEKEAHTSQPEPGWRSLISLALHLRNFRTSSPANISTRKGGKSAEKRGRRHKVL